jgi:repressor LexA
MSKLVVGDFVEGNNEYVKEANSDFHNSMHKIQGKDDNLVSLRFRIPVVSRVSAGGFQSVADIPHADYCEEYIELPFEVKDPDAFALKIEGNSMYPRYSEGDYVIVSPTKEPSNGTPVVAMINSDETTCKIYQEYKDYIRFVPENSDYQMVICHKKDIVWVYPVIAFYRKEF